MRKKKQSARRDVAIAEGVRGRWSGMILERLKRLNGLPLHKLDWQTEYFLNHVLGRKKRA